MAFGWRARIGYITPSIVEINAYEFYKLVPEGVAMVGVTCNIKDWRRDEFDRAIAQVYEIAESLASRDAGFIIHGGVPLVTSRGVGFDRELIEGISSRAGVPATTSVYSGMAALRALGVERVGIVAPYPAEVMEATETFLAGNGFNVEAAVGMDVDFRQLQNMEERTIYSFLHSAVAGNPGIDGIYAPCPQWPIGRMVEVLEADLDMPVVTSIAADTWRACSVLGVSGLSPRGGRLMQLSAPADDALIGPVP